MSHHQLPSEVADHWPKPKASARWLSAALTRLKQGRAARSLPTATSVYLTFAALLVFPAVLKAIKAVSVTEGRAAPLDILRVLSADAALACFSLGAGLLLLHSLRGARAGRLLFAAATVVYLLVLLMLSAVEHQAWARSASLLDWKIFWYTIEHYDELRVVIAAETTTAGVLLLVGAGMLAFLPLVGDAAASMLFGYEGRYRLRYAAFWMLAALPLAFVASGAPRAPELFPLTHSASVGLLSGALDAAEQADSAAGGSFTPPDATRIQADIEATLAAAGLAQDSQGKPKNVLLLVLESTRFDATSVHVPHLETTPRLRQLAQQGLSVDRAYVDMPHTSKALISILCGYSPRWSVQINEAEPGGLPDPCLAHVFGHLGYRRAFFQAATGTYENRHQLALNAGYEEVFTRESYDEAGFEETNYLSVEDKIMLEPALRWVEQNKQKPFFLTLLTCITHHAYGVPSDFRMRPFPRRASRIGGRMPRPWSDYNRYLNTVRYSDELLDELLKGLEAQGVLDDTLVVVVGDHGQAFHEHGQKAHNTVIWDEGLRVPLVMHNRRALPEPRVVEGPRRQVDIAPTVLDLVGVSYRGELFEGRDLLREPPHERVYSSCWYDERCSAETTAEMRVIDHYDNQPMEVYDLAADPFERRNLLEHGDPAQRAHFKTVAAAARERIRAHQQTVGRRYDRSDAQRPAFILAEEPKPQYPVRARLGEFVELLGYDTPSHDVAPDGFWDVVIYFKCLKESPEGWRFFGELRTVDGRRYQVDHHPANGHYFLHQCKAGTLVADHVRAWIPGDFPPGQTGYWWGSVFLEELGHVRRTNRRLGRRSVVPLERGLLVNDQALRLSSLNVEPRYREDLAELRQRSILDSPPPIGQPLNVRFGDDLVLLDASVEPVQAKRLSSVAVRTVWRVDGPVKGPWQILVHMDSHRRGYWLRRAHTPVDGVHPIDNWEPGTYVVDVYNMPVHEQMPRGDATIWVGIRTDRRRMRITDPGSAEVDDHRALAAKIIVAR